MAECSKCGHSPEIHRSGWDCRAIVNYGGEDEICDCHHSQDGMDVSFESEGPSLEIGSITAETLKVLEHCLPFERIWRS